MEPLPPLVGRPGPNVRLPRWEHARTGGRCRRGTADRRRPMRRTTVTHPGTPPVTMREGGSRRMCSHPAATSSRMAITSLASLLQEVTS